MSVYLFKESKKYEELNQSSTQIHVNAKKKKKRRQGFVSRTQRKVRDVFGNDLSLKFN